MRSDQRLSWGKKFILSSLGILFSLAIASPAWAESKSFNFTLISGGSQTFKSLTEQAESLASNSIKQEFAENSSLSEITITILGERNGQEVPLLVAKVSRSQWQAEPIIQNWTRYLGNSATLLGFNKPKQTQATSPNSTVAFRANKTRIEDDPAFRDD